MKKALLTLAALAMAVSSYAQGTITYFNSGIDNATGGGQYDAPIFNIDGVTPITSGFNVGLFHNGTLVPGSVTTFIGAGAPGIFNPVFDLVIPGAAPGSTPSLTVRAWESTAASFDAANIKGEMTFTARGLGGTNPSPPPPSFFAPSMTGMTSFSVVVPEPSTIALGAIGIGALLLRRRK